jgi:hypothetical protein
MATTSKAKKVKARHAVVVVVGARPPVYQTRIVRDRHTGLLAEVALSPSEAEPLDWGDEGIPYAFARGEEVEADHPAALDCPSAFVPVE